jgi:hypothetical protein
MFRNFVAAVAVVCFVSGGLSAAEYKGKVTKIDEEKKTITIAVGAKKGEKGEEKTFTYDAAVKLSTVKIVDKKPVEETITDGFKNEAFSKVGAKGAPNATLITTGEGKDEKVTEIKVTQGKKKKNT